MNNIEPVFDSNFRFDNKNFYSYSIKEDSNGDLTLVKGSLIDLIFPILNFSPVKLIKRRFSHCNVDFDYEKKVVNLCDLIFNILTNDTNPKSYKFDTKWLYCKKNLDQFRKKAICKETLTHLNDLENHITAAVEKDTEISDVRKGIIDLQNRAHLFLKKIQGAQKNENDSNEIISEAHALLHESLHHFELDISEWLLDILSKWSDIDPISYLVNILKQMKETKSNHILKRLQLQFEYHSVMPKSPLDEAFNKRKKNFAIEALYPLQNLKKDYLNLGKTPKIEDFINAIDRSIKDLDPFRLYFCSEFDRFFNDINSLQNQKTMDELTLDVGVSLLNCAVQIGDLERGTWLVSILSKFDRSKEVLAQLALEIEAFKKNNNSELATFEKAEYEGLKLPELKWLLDYAKSLSKEQNFEKEYLDYYALDLGFGYKAANLQFMTNQLERIKQKLTHCDVKVPSFIKFSDVQIRNYLSSQLNFKDILILWEEFLNTFDPNKKRTFTEASNTHAAKELNLLPSEEGIKILEEIQEKIKTAFTDQLFTSPIIQDWISKNPCEYVIVRSTGREDSEKNANAGGNASIPFIYPQPKNISNAIGEVIASYFGQKSIKQRLQAGDQMFFKDPPFLPVLIQMMVCEKNLEGKNFSLRDIPRSGVLFTREQGKAEITVINAAFGSNEGVVTSQVAVDTYYVHRQGVYSVIRQKPTRFVQQISSENHQLILGPIMNDPAITSRAVLSHQKIMDLKKVATELATLYGDRDMKCMDMEYTISFNANGKAVINLLQIRPLMSTKNSFEPSYINLKAIPSELQDKKFKANVLMAGSPFVRRIMDYNEQVIFADDLPKALHEYQDSLKSNAQKVSVIIVKKTAPLTSHECVTLRPTHIPVLVLNKTSAKEVQRLLLRVSPEKPILICPQRGIIIEETSQDLIEKGVISYPGTPEYSSNAAEIKDPVKSAKGMIRFLLNTGKTIDQLLKQLKKEELLDSSLEKFLENSSINNLFEFMAREKNPAHARAATLYLLRRLRRQTKKIIDTLLGNQGSPNEQINRMIQDPLFEIVAKPLFTVFDHAFTVAIYDVIPSFSIPEQHMDRLFYLNALQALVMQQNSNDIVEGHSFANLLAKWKTLTTDLKKQCISMQISNTLDNNYLLFMKEAALSENVQKMWDELVMELNSPSHSGYRHDFLEMIKVLRKLGVFVPWINVVFANCFFSNTQNSVKNLLNIFSQDKKVLEDIQKKEFELDQLARQVENGNWSNPKFVKKNLNDLMKKIKDLGFDERTLNSCYLNSQQLGKLVILEFLQKSLTVFDSIIKGVTGSSEYEEPREKAEHFASVLKGFFIILKTSMEIAKPEEKELMTFDGHFSTNFSLYLKYLYEGRKNYHFGLTNTYSSFGLDEIYDKIPTMTSSELASTFNTRPEFNVSAIAIGSHADLNFSAYWPTTLEEHFTTAHQSTESIIKYLRTKLGFNHSILPERTKKFTDLCSSHFGSPSGIIVQDQTIEVHYPVSLRQHSALIILGLPLKNRSLPLQLTVSAFGDDEHDRWKHLATYGALLAARFNLNFEFDIPPTINYFAPKSVSFKLEVPLNPDNKELHNHIFHSLEHLLTTTTMQGEGGLSQLVRVFQNEGPYKCFNLFKQTSWLNLPQAFYANSLIMNLYAMNLAEQHQEYPTLVQIAESTLKALASYKLKDFATSDILTVYEAKGLDEYFSRNIFPPAIYKSSYKESAFLYLIKAFEIEPKVRNTILNVLKDRLILHHFPQETQTCLNEINITNEKRGKYLLKNPSTLHLAAKLALIDDNKPLIEDTFAQLKGYIEDRFPGNLLLFLKSFVSEVVTDSSKNAFDNIINELITCAEKSNKIDLLANYLYGILKNSKDPATLSNIVNILSKIDERSGLNANLQSDFKYFQEVSKQNVERIKHKTDLVENGCLMYASLKSIESLENFQKHASELVSLAEKVIVGLSQTADLSWKDLFKEKSYNESIEIHESFKKIELDPNESITIRKYHEAASFILVNVLVRPETRNLGIAALKKLIDDYSLFSLKDTGRDFVSSMLFKLIGKYAKINSFTNSEDIVQLLFELWQSKPNLIKDFLSISKLPLVTPSNYGLYAGPVPLLGLEELQKNNITKAIVLLEDDELEGIGLLSAYMKSNISVIHFPIQDKSISKLKSTHELILKILSSLGTENVYLHCLLGKGRTGTIAACLLAQTNPGMSANEAIKITRTFIDNAIETQDQEDFVNNYIKRYVSI